MSQLKIKDNNNQWVDIPAGGVGVPSGGTIGQVLQKSSSTDYATQWVTPQNLPLMGIPDYENAVYINELTVANGTFTALSNGYVKFYILTNATNNGAIYRINITSGNTLIRDVVSYQTPTATGYRTSQVVPVAAGDVLTCTQAENITWTSPSGISYAPMFIPCK